MLDGFAGIIQTDGYVVYKTIAGRADIDIAHCWAHLRRDFFDITKTAPAPIAEEALRRIAQLYAIEAGIRGCTAAERRAVRQERSRPVVEALKQWFELQLGRLSAKSTTAEAIRYAFNQWTGLVRFLEDGRIEIDSNTVERSIRPLVLNRKNALFAGHDRGAENWAVIASLIESCKLQGVNPEAYLADLLTRLVKGWPNARLSELTPWAWAAAQAATTGLAA